MKILHYFGIIVSLLCTTVFVNASQYAWNFGKYAALGSGTTLLVAGFRQTVVANDKKLLDIAAECIDRREDVKKFKKKVEAEGHKKVQQLLRRINTTDVDTSRVTVGSSKGFLVTAGKEGFFVEKGFAFFNDLIVQDTSTSVVAQAVKVPFDVGKPADPRKKLVIIRLYNLRICD